MLRLNYINKLVNKIQNTNYDAVLICPSEELSFFAGFTTIMCERFQGLFIKKDGSMFYFCNLLTGDEVRYAVNNSIPVYTWFDNDSMTENIYRIFKEEDLLNKNIAVNSTAQAFNLMDIGEKTGATFKNGVSLLEESRIIKSESELNNLRIAAKIADTAYENIIGSIKVGMTEGEVRELLINEMESLGGNNAGALIASGPNAGYPHYSRYDRVLTDGDSVIMDFGCIYNEMHSDTSRTVFIGHATKEQKTLYNLVLDAQNAAEDAAELGAYIPDIDYAARVVLDKAGYGDAFITRVGHGIGYMTHEAPYINATNKRNLEKGMCFSIEPGIYIPGKIGIRIENIVAINLQGEKEVLNKSTKELIVIKR